MKFQIAYKISEYIYIYIYIYIALNLFVFDGYHIIIKLITQLKQ